jgi:hypothetical protein
MPPGRTVSGDTNKAILRRYYEELWNGWNLAIAGGKIVDGWVSGDTLSLLQQLGAISTPAQAAGDPS